MPGHQDLRCWNYIRTSDPGEKSHRFIGWNFSSRRTGSRKGSVDAESGVRNRMNRHVLNTERLILRALDSRDAPAIHRLAGAKEIADTTLTVPHPYPFHAAVEWIEKAHKEWKAKTAFVFAITLLETKEFIGGIGLHLTPQDQNAEMGFWVGTPYWNQGYCSEAGKAVMQFGFETLKLHRIFARHFPRNV